MKKETRFIFPLHRLLAGAFFIFILAAFSQTAFAKMESWTDTLAKISVQQGGRVLARSAEGQGFELEIHLPQSVMGLALDTVTAA